MGRWRSSTRKAADHTKKAIAPKGAYINSHDRPESMNPSVKDIVKFVRADQHDIAAPRHPIFAKCYHQMKLLKRERIAGLI